MPAFAAGAIAPDHGSHFAARRSTVLRGHASDDSIPGLDELEGRLIGTAGIQRAADLIASDFNKLGLQPIRGLRVFQPFEMTTSVDPDPEKSLLKIGNRCLWPSKSNSFRCDSPRKNRSEAPVVFAGYGEVNPEQHYDDYGDADVKGKIVLIMRFEPQNPDTNASRFSDANRDYSAHAVLQDKLTAAEHLGA